MVDYLKELKKHVKTEKQRVFDPDFVKDADKYLAWDEVEIGMELPPEQTFEVKAEDIKAYAEAALDPNPLFHDEEYAKNSPYGGLIASPGFYVQIVFWCTGKGHGSSWSKTPGARNPGQKVEFYEPIRPGDVITIKRKAYDKWVKRGKYYITHQSDFVDQNGVLKLTAWGTLILPKTRADVMKFMKGERGLEV